MFKENFRQYSFKYLLLSLLFSLQLRLPFYRNWYLCLYSPHLLIFPFSFHFFIFSWNILAEILKSISRTLILWLYLCLYWTNSAVYCKYCMLWFISNIFKWSFFYSYLFLPNVFEISLYLSLNLHYVLYEYRSFESFYSTYFGIDYLVCVFLFIALMPL